MALWISRTLRPLGDELYQPTMSRVGKQAWWRESWVSREGRSGRPLGRSLMGWPSRMVRAEGVEVPKQRPTAGWSFGRGLR